MRRSPTTSRRRRPTLQAPGSSSPRRTRSRATTRATGSPRATSRAGASSFRTPRTRATTAARPSRPSPRRSSPSSRRSRTTRTTPSCTSASTTASCSPRTTRSCVSCPTAKAPGSRPDMPLVMTPASPIVLTEDEVRRFMRDYPDKNQLLDTVQFSQEEVNQGVEMVVSSYNMLSPVSSISPQGWPAAGKYLLLLGVAAYLALSEAQLQARNQLTYQDGDIAPIGEFDKFPLYLQLSQTMQAQWDRAAREVKTQLNLEAAYG